MIPENSPLLLPLSLDLTIHLFPAIFLFADFLFLSPPFSKQTSPFLLSAGATITYGSWLEYLHSFNQQCWRLPGLSDVLLCFLLDPYPFLNEMNPLVRFGFYAFVSILLVGLFHLVNRIHFGFDRLVGRSVGMSKLQTERKIK
jgi:hypothetical protein